MTLRSNPKKRKSFDTIYIDDDDLSPLQQGYKAKSQTSLLLDLSNNPMKKNLSGNTLSTKLDNSLIKLDHESPKHSVSRKYISKNQTKNETSKHFGEDLSDKNKGYLQNDVSRLFKSASSSDLVFFQNYDEVSSLDENSAIDMVDGPCDRKNYGSNWDPKYIDVLATESMLQQLDIHIEEARQRIVKEKSHNEVIVNQLLTNLTPNSGDKSKKNPIRDYENMNKNAKKTLEKYLNDLKKLQYRREYVKSHGIPIGKSPAEYVKGIDKNDKSKKYPGYFSEILLGNLEKNRALSAEDITKLSDVSIHGWQGATEAQREKNQTSKKSNTYEGKKGMFILEDSTLSKSTSNFQISKNSPINGSVIGDKGWQGKNSKPESMLSSIGKDTNFLNIEATRRKSAHTISPNVSANDLVSKGMLKSLLDDVAIMKRDIENVQSLCPVMQRQTDDLKLDIKTEFDLNSERMMDAVERVDRLELMTNNLRTRFETEFHILKENFKELEDKIEYKLARAKNDLQDNINVCTNSIGLINKKTEQIPLMTNATGDIKVIRGQLLNLLVSLVAFLILLISSGLNIMTKCLSIIKSLVDSRGLQLLVLTITIFIAIFACIRMFL